MQNTLFASTQIMLAELKRRKSTYGQHKTVFITLYNDNLLSTDEHRRFIERALSCFNVRNRYCER
jgi:hypothetical protein